MKYIAKKDDVDEMFETPSSGPEHKKYEHLAEFLAESVHARSVDHIELSIYRWMLDNNMKIVPQ